jgi:arginyl-tRNA synthetase
MNEDTKKKKAFDAEQRLASEITRSMASNAGNLVASAETLPYFAILPEQGREPAIKNFENDMARLQVDFKKWKIMKEIA